MSTAREQIIGIIAGSGEGQTASLRQAAAAVADEILTRHAHELGEQIRNIDTSDQAEGRKWIGWGQPFRQAADFIDPPEVAE